MNVDAEIPHDEGNPETPDYQFVKWMTRNKVGFLSHITSELILFQIICVIAHSEHCDTNSVARKTRGPSSG